MRQGCLQTFCPKCVAHKSLFARVPGVIVNITSRLFMATCTDVTYLPMLAGWLAVGHWHGLRRREPQEHHRAGACCLRPYLFEMIARLRRSMRVPDSGGRVRFLGLSLMFSVLRVLSATGAVMGCGFRDAWKSQLDFQNHCGCRLCFVFVVVT
jgi:hypothetical protein